MKRIQIKSSNRSSLSFKRAWQAGFTLIEMLASLAVLALIMVILTQTFSTVSATWRNTTNQANSFASARAGFEALKLNLSQATLNTYLGYANSSGTTVPLLNPSYAAGGPLRNLVPTQYLRASELHFITGQASTIFQQASIDISPSTPSGQAVFFQAPAGFVNAPIDRPLGTMLNVMGYYISFGPSTNFTPDANTIAVPPRYRYRLMEVIQPGELNRIYGSTSPPGTTANPVPTYAYNLTWLGALGLPNNTVEHPLAENIITMALLPKLPPSETVQSAANPKPSALLSTNYTYDSRAWAIPSGDARWRNQLPPLMELVMVTIDEASALRLATMYGGANGANPPFSDSSQLPGNFDLASVFLQYNNQGPTPPSDLDNDIAKVEAGLTAMKINYRIFRTDLALNNSQWTTN